jgi:predicted  nucleic acid-binding Zn-ribbon protein
MMEEPDEGTFSLRDTILPLVEQLFVDVQRVAIKDELLFKTRHNFLQDVQRLIEIKGKLLETSIQLADIKTKNATIPPDIKKIKNGKTKRIRLQQRNAALNEEIQVLEKRQNDLNKQIKICYNLLGHRLETLLLRFALHTQLYNMNQQTCEALQNLAAKLSGAEESASTEGQEEARPPSPMPGF